MNDISEFAKELLEKKGHIVRMGTPLCKDYQKKHDNVCTGCLSCKACNKMMEITFLHFEGCKTESDSVEQNIKNTKYVAKKTEEILNSD